MIVEEIVDRITAKISFWSSKMLSFIGRLQQVNFVMFIVSKITGQVAASFCKKGNKDGRNEV